jgi:hypothetical protein
LEEDGKGHLAADLRSRASQLASATPGATGHELFAKLQHEQTELDVPRIAQATTEDADPGTDDAPAESKTLRTPRRRSCRRTKTD